MTYTQHALSAAFQAMSADEYRDLRDDIEVNGVLNPITLFEGKVIDGWHRYRAATELMLKFSTQEMPDHVDPKAFVRAQNKHRRHQTAASLALAEVAMAEWRPTGVKSRSAGPADLAVTAKEMAANAGTSTRSIEQAKTVHKGAAPEVKAAVQQGKLGLEKAAAIAQMPKAEQAAAIDKPLPKKQKPVKPATKQEPEPTKPAPKEYAQDGGAVEEKYTEIDDLREQVADLQAALAVASMGDIPESEKTLAADMIAELRKQVKLLEINLDAVTRSRDQLMNENASIKKQCISQQNQIKRLKS